MNEQSNTEPIPGWNLKRKPCPYLRVMNSGREFGVAVWAEGRRWYCWISEFSETSKPDKAAAVRTKRQAVRWLLANSPADSAVNETVYQWSRSAATGMQRISG